MSERASRLIGGLTARMSVYHAPCQGCEWPTAKTMLDQNGLCLACRRTAHKNGVSAAILRKQQRAYARCV